MIAQGFKFICVLALLALLAMAASAIVPLTRGNVVAAPVIHEHALRRHPIDAPKVRSCLSVPGNIMSIWAKNNSERYHILTMLDDGGIGDMIVQMGKDGCWQEITSFRRYEDNLDDVESALRDEATQVWDFRPGWNMVLQWLRGIFG